MQNSICQCGWWNWSCISCLLLPLALRQNQNAVLSQKFQILEKELLNCLSCSVGYTFHTDFHSDMRHIMAKCHVVGQNLTSDLYVMPKWQAAPSVTGIIFLSRVVGLHLWYGLSFSSVRGCDSPHAFWGNWLENLENFSVLKEFTQNTQKIWDFFTTDQILCTICLWIPLGASDVLVVWLLFVSSQDTWISCSDNAYSILVLECTTTWLQSTGASQLPEEAALEVNGFGEAPFGALWRDLNEIEVPDSVPMICCIYPYVCLVGRFWDALKRISSSAGICLLVFEAFFVQVDVLNLLMWKKTLLQQSGNISASISMSFWHWLLAF